MQRLVEQEAMMLLLERWKISSELESRAGTGRGRSDDRMRLFGIAGKERDDGLDTTSIV